MFLAFAGFSALKSIVAVADEFQSLEARIGQLPQTIGAAADSFDVVADRAAIARQGLREYVGFYIKAANGTQDFLKSQEEVLNVADGAALGLAASGATAAAQSQAFFQLGQAIGSPTVQMEEMNTLIDVAPDLFRALGKAIPGANGQLKKFISTGKVTGQMLAKGLIDVAEEFRERMIKMPMGIGTAMVLIGDRFGRFIHRMNRESQTVTKVAKLFIQSFNQIEKALNKFVDRVGGSEQAIKILAIAISAILLPVMAKLALGFVTFLASPLGLAIAALFLLGLAIEDVYQWMNGGSSIFGRWLGDFDELISKIKSFTVALEILKWMGISIATLLTLHFAELAARAVVSFAIMAASWIASFAAMIIAALPVVLIVLLIAAAIAAVLAGLYYLWNNWKTIWQGMKDIAAKVWESLVTGFSAAIDKMKGYWNSFKSFFGMGASTTITASTAAGAASAPAGVPTGTGTSNITINQELPPGTPEQTQRAAREGTTQALAGNPWERTARQMGQSQ